jgi:hypothetical protein
MKVKSVAAVTLMVVGLGSLGSTWMSSQAEAQGWHRGGYRSSALVGAGSTVNVRLDSKISTETAHQGDSWTGTVSQSIYSGDRVMIPAGSPVSGVVTSAAQGTHDARPQISLAVRRVNLNGQSYVMNADTEPIVAGTSRAKKIGAIAGGAAVGALVGHTVAKGSHGTLIGGLLGGAAGYGLTRHAFRTLELQPGTVVSFTTREDVVARR